jgi:hypothetical protein
MRQARIDRPARRDNIRERADRLYSERGTADPRDWRDPDITRAKALRRKG